MSTYVIKKGLDLPISGEPERVRRSSDGEKVAK